MNSCWRKNFRELISLGIVLIAYITNFSISPQNVFWSPDEGVRFIMANSLTSWMDKGSNKEYAGIMRDPEFRFHPGFYKYSGIMYPIYQDDGTYKYPWSIGFPLVSGYLYRIFGITGIYMIPLLCGWMIAILVWRFSLKIKLSNPFFGVILVGLGTPVFFYSQVFWDHTLATLLGLTALFMLINTTKFSMSSIILILVSLFIAIILRIEMLAFAVALGIAWIISRHRSTSDDSPQSSELKSQNSWSKLSISRKFILILFLSITIISIILFAFHFVLPKRYLGEFSRLSSDMFSQLNVIDSLREFLIRNFNALPALLINSTSSEGFSLPPALVWIGLVAVLICFPIAITRWDMLNSYLLLASLFVMLGIVLIAIFTTQNYRSLHGLFICAPYALISAYGIMGAWQKRNYQELVIYLSAAFYLIIGTTTILFFRAGKEVNSWPGLEWGQRYLLTLYPLFVLISLLAIRDYLKSQSPEILKISVISLTIILMVMSVIIQFRGIWMLRESRLMISGWMENLLIYQPEPVITDEWWLPGSLAAFFISNELYSVFDSEDFSEWLSHIGSNARTNFVYVSSNPIDLSSLSLQDPIIEQVGRQDNGGLSIIHYSINQNQP